MYKLKAEIRKAKNGYICELKLYDGEIEEIVFSEVEDDEHKSFTSFLQVLIEHLGPQYQKYGGKNLYIHTLPGYKWEGNVEDLDSNQKEIMLELYEDLKEYFERES